MSTTRHIPTLRDENAYGAHTLHKGNAANVDRPLKPVGASSSVIGPSGLTGGKIVARKALGSLSGSSLPSSHKTPGQEEDQTLIKQGLGNKV
jgi:hypothetical protein